MSALAGSRGVSNPSHAPLDSIGFSLCGERSSPLEFGHFDPPPWGGLVGPLGSIGFSLCGELRSPIWQAKLALAGKTRLWAGSPAPRPARASLGSLPGSAHAHGGVQDGGERQETTEFHAGHGVHADGGQTAAFLANGLAAQLARFDDRLQIG